MMGKTVSTTAPAPAAGATSLRAIAAALTARGIPTPRGREWSAPQVANVLKRAEAAARRS
jgi:Recombinase